MSIQFFPGTVGVEAFSGSISKAMMCLVFQTFGLHHMLESGCRGGAPDLRLFFRDADTRGDSALFLFRLDTAEKRFPVLVEVAFVYVAMM